MLAILPLNGYGCRTYPFRADIWALVDVTAQIVIYIKSDPEFQPRLVCPATSAIPANRDNKRQPE
jgi:hypothetical protein